MREGILCDILIIHSILSLIGKYSTSDNKESKEDDNIGTFDNSVSKASLLPRFEQAPHKNKKRNR